MSDPEHGYEIDYDDLDVEDLVRQIRNRVRHGDEPAPVTMEVDEERLRSRLRTYLDTDDAGAQQLRTRLELGGAWNVSPEDLRESRSDLLGRLISGIRRLVRPFVKLLVNADLPLFKQHKINLGLASALHDLMREHAELQRRVAELSSRLDDRGDRATGPSGSAERPDADGTPDPAGAPDPRGPSGSSMPSDPGVSTETGRPRESDDPSENPAGGGGEA